MENQAGLWNPTKHLLKGKFDGVFYNFAPNEKKVFPLPVNLVLFNHLFMQLECDGLVIIPGRVLEMPLEEGKIEMEKLRASGLEARKRTLDMVVRNFRTMNKEREAAKLSAEQPTDHIIACVNEIEEIEAEIYAIKKESIDKVNRYLDSHREDDAEEKISSREKKIDKRGKLAKESASV